MLDIVVAAFCSANCALHCTTDKPKGEGDRHSPGDVEHARSANIPCINVAFGALPVTVGEPPGKRLACRADDAVSLSAVPATNCELACTESWERVSPLRPLGDDIFVHSTETIPCEKIFKTAVLELGIFFLGLP